MKSLIGDLKIDFMGKRKFALILSSALVLVAIAALFSRGLNLGVDFTGGYTIEVGYETAANLDEVRTTLASNGFEEAVVQTFGTNTDVLIRIPPSDELTGVQLSTKVTQALEAASAEEVTMRRVEFVGPQVGEELRETGGLAVLAALFAIVCYIWIRFEKKFSVGSVLALVHDVVITLGIFALFQIEFDLTILAALLAVIGYSLNDTIVVFDRIRENFLGMRRGSPSEIINVSVNQTLSRTIITSLTTLLVLLALFFLGGKIINGFALALIIGVVVGTYSSIFVASTAVLQLGITKEDLMPVEKEGAEFEEGP